jgi:hypothetical protein
MVSTAVTRKELARPISGPNEERAAPAANVYPYCRDTWRFRLSRVWRAEVTYPDDVRLPLCRRDHGLGSRTFSLAATQHDGIEFRIAALGGGDRVLWQARDLQHRSGSQFRSFAFTNSQWTGASTSQWAARRLDGQRPELAHIRKRSCVPSRSPLRHDDHVGVAKHLKQ